MRGVDQLSYPHAMPSSSLRPAGHQSEASSSMAQAKADSLEAPGRISALKTSVPKLPKGFVLVSGPSERARKLFEQICKYLDEDFGSIRSMNLGVKSGTGVVDELLLRKVHTHIQELHTLAISHPAAAQALEKAARRLDASKMQQLQVLLDKVGHEHLSDYLRLAVFNVRSPFAKQPVDVVPEPDPVVPRRRRSRAPSLRRGATGGRSTMCRTSLEALPPFTGQRPTREEIVRWAGLLPEDHPLVQAGYRLYLSRLPVDSPELDDGADNDADGLNNGKVERNRYGHAMALHEERALLEAARRKLPEIPLWTDVERLWQQTCHTHHPHDLLNPIMVSSATPLYTSLPDFKRKLQEAEAAKAVKQMASVSAQHATMSSARRQIAPSRQPSANLTSRATRTPRTPSNAVPQDTQQRAHAAEVPQADS